MAATSALSTSWSGCTTTLARSSSKPRNNVNEKLAAKLALAGQQAPQTRNDLFPDADPELELHVDGDYAAYFCAGNDETSAGIARKSLVDRIESAKFMSGARGRCVVHLSASGCTKANRFHIATVKPYQGQRNSSKRPKNWQMLRDFMAEYSGIEFVPKIWTQREADDGVAFMAGIKRIAIMTRDKDFRMFGGLHVAWMDYILTEVPRDTFDLIGQDGLQYGHKWFWLQMLQGDTADNIPGLPKYVKPNGVAALCGEATAGKLLSDVQDNTEAFKVVRGLYSGFYGEDAADRLLEQALLLWMRDDAGASERNVLRILPNIPWVTDALERTIQRVEKSIAETNDLSGEACPSEAAQ
ncbi:exonuclease [Ralstonia phage RSJ5]|uniref:Putative DNA exonuclease n=1 Tax=Ralstonia phage RSJ5 TaxID=1538364 RepID=A0A077KVP0_9CAUD|nr:exonuclease [Ralstonia phage RSJ5]BAP34913.1 putative DNA exonuclease [Ralstonia phage RSJ5]